MDDFETSGGRGRVFISASGIKPEVAIQVRQMGTATAWLTSEQARALAALLLKHADRAEGREA